MNNTKRVLATLALAGAALATVGTAYSETPGRTATNSTMAAPADDNTGLINLEGGIGLLGGANVGD